VTQAGDLDLRRKKDAAAMERGLLTLDVTSIIADADGR
jgi:hypothetical protein